MAPIPASSKPLLDDEERAGHDDSESSPEDDIDPSMPTKLRSARSQSILNSWPFRALAITGFFFLFLVLIGLGRQSLPWFPGPPKQGKKITHIASLGSSFAAGPGIPTTIDPYAGRSDHNYAALLSRHVNVDLTDLSVGGATLLNLLSEPQNVGGHVFAPQIDDIPADADLILALGGGNDLDYIGKLLGDNGQSLDFADAWDWWSNSDYSVTALESAVALADRWGLVLDAVHKANPDATVLVVEYVTLLGAEFEAGVDAPFGNASAAEHEHRAEMLHNGTVLAVEAAQSRGHMCHLVPVARLSWHHGIGSAEPWANDYRGQPGGGASYHPNLEGMEAIEHMIFQKLVELDLIDDREL